VLIREYNPDILKALKLIKFNRTAKNHRSSRKISSFHKWEWRLPEVW